ncbi:MAG: phenylalanine--tRNA ligase subunit beta [Chlamydiales bacterium]|nr:phenylalanine--tRNA ligase subunit beta [Chlamydiales bacterium]
MKFALSWIKEWVDLDGLAPEQIGDALTMGGAEVDKIERSPLSFSGVVVGKVLSAEQHPDADRLRVARVTDGKDEFQVVCGAPNCRAGMKTAFAMVGAVLDGGKIKKGKMRGVESFGMLCGADELRLGNDTSGIMELDAPVGTDLSELYGDVIFEISLTPNLGHCMSVLGLARELSALLERPLKTPKIHVASTDVKSSFGLCIEDKEQCLAYAYRVIENVKVKPSPEWIVKRLEAIGMRSINNIVDITNLVMLERGQPLHAFDADLIENSEIRIRSDQTGAFVTLDGIKRELPQNTLMICDGKKPIAIAGIMGGANSEISETTTTILLEAAVFSPTSIRKASKALNLRTDASARFEKGIDPLGLEAALDRAAELIGGRASIIYSQTKEPHIPLEITLRLSSINALLGSHLSLGDVEQILTSLCMQVRSDSNDVLTVGVPSYRRDITQEVDLIEEVGRIYGYNHLPKRQMRIAPSTIPHNPLYLLENRVRKLCQGEGLLEFITCDLIGPSDLQFVAEQSDLLSVMHPSSIDQSILRPSLLPSMMQSVAHNFDHQNHTINAFEIGRIHPKSGEMTCLSILLTGKQSPHTITPKAANVDFFDLKGHIENLFAGLDIELVSMQSHVHPLFHPGRSAKIIHGDFELGILGQIHPKLSKADIYFAEINLNEVLKLCPSSDKQLIPLPKYPGSQVDWTIEVPESMEIDHILKNILKQRSQLLENVFLLDLFRKVPGSKAATFRFSYRHANKTLSAEAIEREHTRLITTIEKDLHK